MKSYSKHEQETIMSWQKYKHKHMNQARFLVSFCHKTQTNKASRIRTKPSRATKPPPSV
jgi:hypothetical protein